MCSGELLLTDRVLGCTTGHRFDLARQGYVSLLSGRGTAHRSDTADMVTARTRVFADGLYSPLQDAVARACIDPAPGIVVDAAGGTGAYLAAALGGSERIGVSLDLSKACARAAARVHPRAISVVADLWSAIPIADGVAARVLSVFAPRNPAETARVLAPGGAWVIVTPNPGHLAEIVEPMGMLRVGEGKSDRLEADLRADFVVEQTSVVTARRELSASRLADVAGMGPAGFHRTRDELAAAARALAGDGSVAATLDVTLTVARRR
ncbi:putative RNA methyltransferase [Gordonia humi]|uniref:putative RNA methyltransferase n=1 Tax=Gordonia humi TaxID=686429 RepID=UPI0031EC7D3A